jgi:hypothetical protein
VTHNITVLDVEAATFMAAIMNTRMNHAHTKFKVTYEISSITGLWSVRKIVKNESIAVKRTYTIPGSSWVEMKMKNELEKLTK